ncbi:hypothetical protein [Ekhidna sp. To15]|uniref:hypothetical protein n=1 Tax=Ekhidna sp. To15 TaxID=3395267 RepID=UPI003F5217E4
MKWLLSIWKKFKQLLIRLLEDKQSEIELEEKSQDKEVLISHRPGLVCPECGYKIPVNVDMLLSGSPIECPSCTLKLNVEQEQSKPVLDRLRKLDDTIKKASSVNQ